MTYRMGMRDGFGSLSGKVAPRRDQHGKSYEITF